MRDTGHDILDLVPGPVKSEAARLLNRLRNEHFEQSEQFDKNFKPKRIKTMHGTKMLEVATLVGVVLILMLVIYQTDFRTGYYIVQDRWNCQPENWDRDTDTCLRSSDPVGPGQVLPVPPNPTEPMDQ